MVNLHFPSNLTEEEVMLQSKYQKLRKKKKALQLLKAPKSEPEKPIVLKRSSESKDPKEVAKKLLKSGAISAIKVENKEKQGFKRSKNLERKLSSTEKPGSVVSGYQPFSQAHPSEEEDTQESASQSSGHRPAIKGLYESFVSSRKSESQENDRASTDSRPEPPKQGHTLYVHGYGITEEILRSGFSPMGNILNISMEMEKNCGFITYEKMEDADKAIKEMNGSMVMGIQIKASFARRQPILDPATENSSSVTWSTIAASHSQKGCHKDKRELVQYEDIF